MKVVLKHESGLVKPAKLGYSWTVLFFGLFVPLIRGDIRWAAIMFAISLLAGAFTLGIGSLVSNIIFSFVYNKLYVRGLLEKGYRPTSEGDELAVNNYVNR